MFSSSLLRTYISKQATKPVASCIANPTRSVRFFAAASENMTPRIMDTIKQDHRDLEAYYDKIINSTDPEEQTRFQNQFTWELARHSHGEELVVYPAFEKHLKDGHAMAEKDRGEHQTVSPSPRDGYLVFLAGAVDKNQY